MPKSETTPAPKSGDKLDFWPVQKPFVGRGPYPAKVVEDLGADGLRLAVDNPNTKRAFFANAQLSAEPASGVCTRPAGAAAVPAPAAVTTSIALEGSGGGSA